MSGLRDSPLNYRKVHRTFLPNFPSKALHEKFGVSFLVSPPLRKITEAPFGYLWYFWSGLRDSNSLPSPWQGDALPDELNPHIWCFRTESNHRHEDFQSSALPTELQKHKWRPGTGSNRRPLA